LCTDEDISAVLDEMVEDKVVRAAEAGGVRVPAQQAGGRELIA